MKFYRNIITLLLILLIVSSCEKDKNIDTEKPVITIDFAGASPVNCDTLYFGESVEIRMLFTDNEELGSFGISIHQNFDHHSHSTEVTECHLDTVKDPVNPFEITEDYNIPAGLQDYTTNFSIAIPADDKDRLFDEGDYHFFLSLTDSEGWSTRKGLSIKMLHR